MAGERPGVFQRIGGGIQLEHLLRFALADINLVALRAELNTQRIAVDTLDHLTRTLIKDQRRFGLRIIGDKQAAGGRIFRQIEEQVLFAVARRPALLNFVAGRVNHQNFTAAVCRINAIGVRGVDKPRHPLPGVINAPFEGHGLRIHDGDKTRIGHAANKQLVIVEQHFTGADRVAVLILTDEHQAL